MELKKGYKQTEVGVIPVDWEVKTLGSITSLLTNGFVGTVTNFYSETDDGVLYIQGYNVEENGFNLNGIKRVTKAFHAQHQKSCLREGDLLTIQTGDIGVTTVVPRGFAGANCHALVISRLDNRVSEPNFYCQYFNSERGRVAFKEIETGSTMKHLNVGDMKLLPLPFPPVVEQRAIAAALSDVDGLIGGLEQFIAKKRDLKQAAMQQLLTGKKRLAGFRAEWVTKTLGKIASVTKGTQLHSSESDTTGKFAHLNGGISPSGYTDEANTPANTIAISEGGNSCGFVQFMIEPYWCGGHCYSVIPTGIQNKFLYHALKGQQSLIMGLRVGSGLPNVQKTGLLAYNLHFPTDEAEQTAIAEVLSDMDAEIAALEQRRDKTRDLKQGMMQALLTGKTRLV